MPLVTRSKSRSASPVKPSPFHLSDNQGERDHDQADHPAQRSNQSGDSSSPLSSAPSDLDDDEAVEESIHSRPSGSRHATKLTKPVTGTTVKIKVKGNPVNDVTPRSKSTKQTKSSTKKGGRNSISSSTPETTGPTVEPTSGGRGESGPTGSVPKLVLKFPDGVGAQSTPENQDVAGSVEGGVGKEGPRSAGKESKDGKGAQKRRRDEAKPTQEEVYRGIGSSAVKAKGRPAKKAPGTAKKRIIESESESEAQTESDDYDERNDQRDDDDDEYGADVGGEGEDTEVETPVKKKPAVKGGKSSGSSLLHQATEGSWESKKSKGKEKASGESGAEDKDKTRIATTMTTMAGGQGSIPITTTTPRSTKRRAEDESVSTPLAASGSGSGKKVKIGQEKVTPVSIKRPAKGDKLDKVEKSEKVEKSDKSSAGLTASSSSPVPSLAKSSPAPNTKRSHHPVPAPGSAIVPRPSLLGSTLALLGGGGRGKDKDKDKDQGKEKSKEKDEKKGREKDEKNRDEETRRHVRPGAWTDDFYLTPEQEAEYESSRALRESEAAQRRKWATRPLKMQESRDAYRVDSATTRSGLAVPGGLGIMTRTLPSQMVAAYLSSTPVPNLV